MEIYAFKIIFISLRHIYIHYTLPAEKYFPFSAAIFAHESAVAPVICHCARGLVLFSYFPPFLSLLLMDAEFSSIFRIVCACDLFYFSRFSFAPPVRFFMIARAIHMFPLSPHCSILISVDERVGFSINSFLMSATR